LMVSSERQSFACNNCRLDWSSGIH
jgi:hypothetical protein